MTDNIPGKTTMDEVDLEALIDEHAYSRQEFLTVLRMKYFSCLLCTSPTTFANGDFHAIFSVFPGTAI